MFEFIRKWYYRNLSNPPSAVLLLQFITIYLLVYYGSGVFGPLIAALVLAFIFERPVSFMVKHGISRTKAASIIMMIALLVAGGIVFAVAPPAVKQLTTMTQKIGIAINNSNTPVRNEATDSDGDRGKIFSRSEKILPESSAGAKEAPEMKELPEPESSDEAIMTPDSVQNSQERISEESATPVPEAAPEISEAQRENTPDALPENAIPENSVPANTIPESTVSRKDSTALQKNALDAPDGNAVKAGNPEAQDSGEGGEEATADSKKAARDEIDKAENNKAMNWITEQFNKIRSKLPESYQNIVTIDQLKSVVDYLEEGFKNLITPAIKQIAPLFMNTMSFITVYVIIVPIFSFFMLKDKDRLLGIIGHYCSAYEEVANFWKEINRLITQYFIGNIIHIAIVAVINGMFLWIMDLNYALLLGIGVGLSVLVPYVGMVIITVPIVAVGIMQFGLSGDLAILLTIYAVIQLVDAYVITPMLFSETLNMDAFSILVSVFVFGGIWGFWGIVLAIPLAIFVKTVVTMWPTRELPESPPPEELPPPDAVQS